MRRVSFVATIYNKADFLPHVVAGLAAQSGPFEREFIFIDDGSSDGSADLLERLTARLERVQIIRQANQGPAIAMNRGLAAASGDLLKPLDGDDLLFPWATRRLLEAMEARNTRWATAFPFPQPDAYDLAIPPEASLAALKPDPPSEARTLDLLPLSIERARTNPTLWLAQTEAVLEVGGCDPRVFVQDYSVELRMGGAFPAAIMDERIAAMPLQTAGRLSNNQAQEMHDGALSIALYCEDGRRISNRLRRRALARVARRAWSWARRRTNASPISEAFLLDLLAQLRLTPPTPEAFRRVADVFRRRARIRLAAPAEPAALHPPAPAL